MYKTKQHTIFLRLFLLAIFISYYADVTFFAHTHIINGTKIIHSHYSCDPDTSKDNGENPGHSHSTKALALITHYSEWTALFENTPDIPEDIFSYLSTEKKELKEYILTRFISDCSLRAPPSIA